MSSASAGIGPDGKIYCKHMEEAVKRKSNTAKHPNRDVYCCKRSPGDPTRCNFWLWADQLPSDLPNESTPSSSAGSPSKRGPLGSTAGHPHPRQKQTSSPSSTIVTPQNKKRMEDIEAGLRQRKYDLSPIRLPGPSRELNPSTSPLPIVPQPPSPVPTEVDSDEVEVQPRTFSFLGLSYSPEVVASAIKDEGQPSTPKKRRLFNPPTDVMVPSTGGPGLLLTPPQTTYNRKGKEREVVQSQDQGGSNRWEPQSEDSLPLFTLAEDISTPPSMSPTTAENVLDFTDGMKARVKALSEYMNSFDITQAAKLLQMVERQKTQYEHRDRSQKMRIEELIAENSRLKAALKRAEERGIGMGL